MKLSIATELLVDLARIQQSTGTKRTALVAAARKRWAGKVWSNDELTTWARDAWKTGVR